MSYSLRSEYLIVSDEVVHDELICGAKSVLVCLDIQSVKGLMLLEPSLSRVIG